MSDRKTEAEVSATASKKQEITLFALSIGKDIHLYARLEDGTVLKVST